MVNFAMAINYVLILVKIFCSVELCISAGLCSRSEKVASNNGYFYYTKYFCCDNYENNGLNGCRACPIGFTSEAKSNCHACSVNTFGWRCAENCKCGPNERCHNVHGCIKTEDENNITQTNSSSTEYNQSTWFIEESTVMMTERRHGKKYHTTTLPIQSRDLKEIKMAVLITSGSILILAFVVVVSLAFYCWKRNRPKHIIVSNREQNQIVNDEHHEYHEIDETNMCPDALFVGNQENIIQNVHKVSDDSDDGYLCPIHIPDMREDNLGNINVRVTQENIKDNKLYNPSEGRLFKYTTDNICSTDHNPVKIQETYLELTYV